MEKKPIRPWMVLNDTTSELLGYLLHEIKVEEVLIGQNLLEYKIGKARWDPIKGRKYFHNTSTRLSETTKHHPTL
jgi:hypothetical protein